MGGRSDITEGRAVHKLLVFPEVPRELEARQSMKSACNIKPWRTESGTTAFNHTLEAL